MKKWFMITFSILVSIIGLSASATILADFENVQNVQCQQETTEFEPVEEIDWVNMDWDTANFYAYMNLEQAEESVKPMILAARNKIIFSESWAEDGITAYVKDADGNIVEELPHFSELFPEDWKNPAIY